MGFVVIVVVLGIIAAIGFAVLYVGLMVMLAIIGVCCLLAFALLYAVLGEQNVGWAIILSLPIGISVAIMLLKREHS